MIMRYYKSFILFGMFAWTFTSCNTDDLERNIDALTDRVVNMEAQIQRLNDNMNLIRVMLDGNQTITEWSENNGTYTLKLSNGETLTLTPGNEDQKNYPSIEIGSNGNWVIGGVETDWRAEAQNGNDATITPQFKIEANAADGGKKYWYVSYDEGKTWEVLENGLAEGTNENKNPITKAEVKGDAFEVTFDGKLYQIPIVKGLECAINLPKNEAWAVAAGQPASFKVKVNLAEGDLVRVNAPVEWKASVAAYKAGDKEVTVNVTAPATPSECVISVEVTHGVNAAIDKVTAKVASDSYWADYQAGLDIKIGDVVINKFDFPEAELITETEAKSFTTFESDKVYFIDADVTMTAKTAIKDYMILINNNPNRKASVKMPEGKYIGFNSTTGTGLGLLCKGIEIDGTENKAYLFTLEGKKADNPAYTFDFMVFDDCLIKLGKENKQRALFSISSSNAPLVSIKNILITSSKISLADRAVETRLFNLHPTNKTFANSYVQITNNVFYSQTENANVELKLFIYAESVANLVIERNTFVNVVPNGSQAFIQSILSDQSSMVKNIVWNNAVYDKECNWISSMKGAATPADKLKVEDNLVFDKNDTKWFFFRGGNGAPEGLVNAITPKTGSPFASKDFATGSFVLNDTYKGKYGADIK